MIKAVMLAGRASRLPLVREMLEQKLKPLPIVDEFQDIAIATGLARHAALFDDEREPRLIRDAMYRQLYMRNHPGMRAFRRFGEALPIPFGVDAHRIGTIEDVTHQKFLPLLDPFFPVLTETIIWLEFRYAFDEFDLETFESGSNPAVPFEPRRRWLLRFSEPVSRMSVTVELDVNRNVTLGIRRRGRIHPECGTGRPRSEEGRQAVRWRAWLKAAIAARLSIVEKRYQACSLSR